MGMNTNENLKHRQGIAGKAKYTCPHCSNGLAIKKPMYLVTCSKCKKLITENEIIVNDG